MIRAFYDYWREPNKSNSKMKWETERTWKLELRLSRWSNNNFGNKPVTPVKTEQTPVFNHQAQREAEKAALILQLETYQMQIMTG